MKAIKLHRSTEDSLKRNLDQIRERIRQRAHTFFQTRGGRIGSALDDWLMAERETLWRPPIEVSQQDGRIVVEADVAGLEPDEIDLQVTPETLLITAEARHVHTEAKGQVHVCEFAPGPLFRTVALPAPIDPAGVKAKCRNGLLTITATVAAPRKTPIDVEH
jgi:HSP20 family protein